MTEAELDLIDAMMAEWQSTSYQVPASTLAGLVSDVRRMRRMLWKIKEWRDGRWGGISPPAVLLGIDAFLAGQPEAPANAPCRWCGAPEAEHGTPEPMVGAPHRTGRLCGGT